MPDKPDRGWLTQGLLAVITILMTSILAMGWARFDRTDQNLGRLEQKLDRAVEQMNGNRERLRSLETIHEQENR